MCYDCMKRCPDKCPFCRNIPRYTVIVKSIPAMEAIAIKEKRDAELGEEYEKAQGISASFVDLMQQMSQLGPDELGMVPVDEEEVKYGDRVDLNKKKRKLEATKQGHVNDANESITGASNMLAQAQESAEKAAQAAYMLDRITIQINDRRRRKQPREGA